MKKLSLTLAAVFAATSMTAFAAPTQMSEAEMDKIVAGKTLYVWENKDGDLFVTSKELASPGQKRGWVGSSITSCDTVTELCGAGTISQVFNESTSKMDWVYSPPL